MSIIYILIIDLLFIAITITQTVSVVADCLTYQLVNFNYCSTCEIGFTLVDLNNGAKGCIKNDQVIKGCLKYIYGVTSFCDHESCDIANSYSQINQLNSIVGITCIQSHQLKPNCASYKYDAHYALYLCQSCIGSQILLPVSLNPITINICIQGEPILGCFLYEINTAQPVCQLCGTSNFAGIDSKSKSLCVPISRQVNYCVNYDPTDYFCEACAGGVKIQTISVGEATIYNCPVLPGDIIPNCTAVNITGIKIKCIQCQLGWLLLYKQSTCVQMVPHCKNYKGSDCQQCIPGFIIINQTCLGPSDYCEQVNSTNNYCLRCTKGYVVNSKGTCDADKSCPNYMLRDKLSKYCVNGSISHCKVYNLNGSCFQCDINYQIIPINFTCKLTPVPIQCPNDTLAYRYIVINNVCIEGDINCRYYLPNGYCYWCIPNFYAFRGLCYDQSQPVNLTHVNLGSKNQTTTRVIITCKINFYLNDSKCVPIPQNCLNFNITTKICDTCENGYTLLRKNICELQLICPTGFYRSGDVCILIDFNCVRFNSQTNNCDLCANGYLTQGTTCLPIALILGQCPDDKTWAGPKGLCIQVSATCDRFNKQTGYCITCVSNYQIVFPGICGVKLDISSLKCPKGLLLIVNSKCVPVIPNCKIYDKQFGYCLTCKIGYEIAPTVRVCSLVAFF